MESDYATNSQSTKQYSDAMDMAILAARGNRQHHYDGVLENARATLVSSQLHRMIKEQS